MNPRMLLASCVVGGAIWYGAYWVWTTELQTHVLPKNNIGYSWDNSSSNSIMCKLGEGQWFPAREDGMCYSDDDPLRGGR